MRFSFWPIASQSWDDILALGHHIERTGWDGVWFADHFMPDTERGEGPIHEAWAIIAALAASVPRVRLGPMVLSNTFRHPALVANIAASVDHISGGRLVLGLGGGVREYEHTAYGLEFHTVGTRLRRLDEACQVVKALLSQQRTDFEGRYYNLADAPMSPKPLQDNVPLMIGGGGEKVTLRIAAQYADEWNVWGTVDRLKHKMAILDAHCERLERSTAAIQRSAAVLVYMSDDQALVRRINGEPQPRPSIAGNSSQLADIIASYAEAGVDELIVPDFHLPLGADASKTDFLDQFIQEVAPAGRNT